MINYIGDINYMLRFLDRVSYSIPEFGLPFPNSIKKDYYRSIRTYRIFPGGKMSYEGKDIGQTNTILLFDITCEQQHLVRAYNSLLSECKKKIKKICSETTMPYIIDCVKHFHNLRFISADL